MDNFYIYQKKASGNSEAQINIAALIPVGKGNTITRTDLTAKCLESGLIDANSHDPDRAMRKLIEKARIDYVILNNPSGGYYRPSKEDLPELRRYIQQEKSRAKAVFRNIKKASALEADLKVGRLDGDA